MQREMWILIKTNISAHLSLTAFMTDTLLNVFLAIAVDNLANAQELTKVCSVFTCLPVLLVYRRNYALFCFIFEI